MWNSLKAKMDTPIFNITQTQTGWQAVFAYQVFHRSAEEWLRMRWGFNAGALLEEALDRYKLFIESQSTNEFMFKADSTQNNTLALRGIVEPTKGLKMVLLGKSHASDRERALQAAQQYARRISSTFPYDFLIAPARSEKEYHELSGEALLTRKPFIVQIQRGMLDIPIARQYIRGVWNAGVRSNEQIWRALSAAPQAAFFNILVQPTILFENEKQALLEIKKQISNFRQDEAVLSYIPWVENYIKRRLVAGKKFFTAQIHLVINREMEDLIHSIGSAFTRDIPELASLGYQTRHSISASDNEQWCENIRLLDLIESPLRLDDVADLEEVFSIFRFPYRPESGLPGANFIEAN
jgi:hypothetical protein